ncbi:hypothetical protein [Fluviicola taffensis]|uniref:Uncharacterized protein n=1 Tax=Fluviicola taffensis (strain DSM 16823 / NCIMB 13979 / RW262) TaxID=755732 RepID=F2ICS8_FLUTR|nr:hypothetical protein [Fluviicola taffensis]AEA43302.1 hypothetical protein Fluta_1307 [Fluviicola taffensis DSM 16823]
MKKLIKISAFATFLFVGAFGIQSFTSSSASSSEKVLSNIQFKVINDTSSEYKYCVNGGHNYISAGASKGFSYTEGTEVKHLEGDNCGSAWFKVTSDMHGKSFKLSELK